MKTRFENMEISDTMFAKKLGNYINQFYKILPIRESGEPTLPNYIQSLQREMLGNQALITALNDDPQYLALLSTLQYMVDHDCDVATTKSEVFKCISIIKRMQAKFPPVDGGDHRGKRVGKV